MTPDEIRAIPDPAARIRAARAALAETAALSVELAQITRDTVKSMRKTMSLAQVAEQLGVSRTRVTQLER